MYYIVFRSIKKKEEAETSKGKNVHLLPYIGWLPGRGKQTMKRIPHSFTYMKYFVSL
jgi:hypothetical protein